MRLLPQDGQSRITLGEPGSGWWVYGMAHLHPEPPSGDWDKPGGGFDRVLGAGLAPEAADLMQQPHPLLRNPERIANRLSRHAIPAIYATP
jgi:hypothetical protein